MARGAVRHYVMAGLLWLAIGVGSGYWLSWQQQKKTQQQQTMAHAQTQLIAMGRIISVRQRFRAIIHIENSDKIGQIGSFGGFTTATTRLLLVVHYNVLAGIDLHEGFSIYLDEKTSELVVSHQGARIFEVNADHTSIEQLINFSRWRTVSLQDFLPTIAEHRMQVTKDALASGVLIQATSVGQRVLRQWLAEQGFNKIRFEVVDL